MATWEGRRFWALAILLTQAPLLAGCGGSAGDTQASGLVATFLASSPAATSDVVYLRLRRAAGDMVSVDVVGRAITAPVDGFDFAISFDPGIVEAFGVSGDTVLGKCGRIRPDNTLLVCQDNAGGSASQSGVLLFSAYTSISPPPSPAVIGADETLATVTFRARSRGTSPIYFYVQAQPAPGTGSFSSLTSGTDPGAAAMVAFEPDAPGQDSIRVKRQ